MYQPKALSPPSLLADELGPEHGAAIGETRPPMIRCSLTPSSCSKRINQKPKSSLPKRLSLLSLRPSRMSQKIGTCRSPPTLFAELLEYLHHSFPYLGLVHATRVRCERGERCPQNSSVHEQCLHADIRMPFPSVSPSSLLPDTR